MTWALANFPRPPLLLVPTENPLDHGSGWSRLKKLYFEDLNLRGHSAIFFLV